MPCCSLLILVLGSLGPRSLQHVLRSVFDDLPSDVWRLCSGRLVVWMQGRPFAVAYSNESLSGLAKEFSLTVKDILLVNSAITQDFKQNSRFTAGQRVLLPWLRSSIAGTSLRSIVLRPLIQAILLHFGWTKTAPTRNTVSRQSSIWVPPGAWQARPGETMSAILEFPCGDETRPSFRAPLEGFRSMSELMRQNPWLLDLIPFASPDMVLPSLWKVLDWDSDMQVFSYPVGLIDHAAGEHDGPPGVRYCAASDTFLSRVTYRNRVFFLGSYKKREEALSALHRAEEAIALASSTVRVQQDIPAVDVPPPSGDEPGLAAESQTAEPAHVEGVSSSSAATTVLMEKEEVAAVAGEQGGAQEDAQQGESEAVAGVVGSANIVADASSDHQEKKVKEEMVALATMPLDPAACAPPDDPTSPGSGSPGPSSQLLADPPSVTLPNGRALALDVSLLEPRAVQASDKLLDQISLMCTAEKPLALGAPRRAGATASRRARVLAPGKRGSWAVKRGKGNVEAGTSLANQAHKYPEESADDSNNPEEMRPFEEGDWCVTVFTKDSVLYMAKITQITIDPDTQEPRYMVEFEDGEVEGPKGPSEIRRLTRQESRTPRSTPYGRIYYSKPKKGWVGYYMATHRLSTVQKTFAEAEERLKQHHFSVHSSANGSPSGGRRGRAPRRLNVGAGRGPRRRRQPSTLGGWANPQGRFSLGEDASESLAREAAERRTLRLRNHRQRAIEHQRVETDETRCPICLEEFEEVEAGTPSTPATSTATPSAAAPSNDHDQARASPADGHGAAGQAEEGSIDPTSAEAPTADTLQLEAGPSGPQGQAGHDEPETSTQTVRLSCCLNKFHVACVFAHEKCAKDRFSLRCPVCRDQGAYQRQLRQIRRDWRESGKPLPVEEWEEDGGNGDWWEAGPEAAVASAMLDEMQGFSLDSGTSRRGGRRPASAPSTQAAASAPSSGSAPRQARGRGRPPKKRPHLHSTSAQAHALAKRRKRTMDDKDSSFLLAGQWTCQECCAVSGKPIGFEGEDDDIDVEESLLDLDSVVCQACKAKSFPASALGRRVIMLEKKEREGVVVACAADSPVVEIILLRLQESDRAAATAGEDVACRVMRTHGAPHRITCLSRVARDRFRFLIEDFATVRKRIEEMKDVRIFPGVMVPGPVGSHVSIGDKNPSTLMGKSVVCDIASGVVVRWPSREGDDTVLLHCPSGIAAISKLKALHMRTAAFVSHLKRAAGPPLPTDPTTQAYKTGDLVEVAVLGQLLKQSILSKVVQLEWRPAVVKSVVGNPPEYSVLIRDGGGGEEEEAGLLTGVSERELRLPSSIDVSAAAATDPMEASPPRKVLKHA